MNQTPEQIPAPRVTDKMRAALDAAASDEHGWIPIGTAGRVLGELYRSGLARKSEPSEIPEITEAGREYVTQVKRAPMPTPEQIAAEMRANPYESYAIAIGHIRAIMRPGQTSATAGMSTGAKFAAVEDVLAALDEAEGEAR